MSTVAHDEGKMHDKLWIFLTSIELHPEKILALGLQLIFRFQNMFVLDEYIT